MYYSLFNKKKYRLNVKKHEVLRRIHFETLLESEQVSKYSGFSIWIDYKVARQLEIQFGLD